MVGLILLVFAVLNCVRRLRRGSDKNGGRLFMGGTASKQYVPVKVEDDVYTNGCPLCIGFRTRSHSYTWELDSMIRHLCILLMYQTLGCTNVFVSILKMRHSLAVTIIGALCPGVYGPDSDAVSPPYIPFK